MRSGLKKSTQILFSRPCHFKLSVLTLAQLPKSDLPEIAFCGRSNCGKSSLLNRLVDHKQLARASRTPGRTRALNFFLLGNEMKNKGNIYLVDMPGYGYAKASKSDITIFQKLSHDYLKNRRNLRLVFLLIDARRGIIDIDRNVINFFTIMAIPFLVILTKQDQITQAKQIELSVALNHEIANFPSALPELIVTSARKNQGIDTLRERLALLIQQKSLA